VMFDKFGGHVQLTGLVDISLDVRLRIAFGLDSNGDFFFETNGTDPEVVVSNIHVVGDLEGEGQFGFLSVQLENTAVNINGITIDVNLVTAGGKLTLDDLTESTIEDLTTITVNGVSGDDAVL